MSTRKEMFASTGRDLHQDTLLANIAMNYRPQGFIADMIAPIVNVQKQSDTYAIFSRAEALTVETDNRAPGTAANVITRSVSSDTYFAKNYALKMPVTVEDRVNADPIYMQTLINGRAGYITSKLLLNWEKRLADQVTNTSNVGSSSAVSSAWTDYDNSDPLSDMDTAIDNVEDSTSYRPNRVVFGQTAWRNFRRNANVLNRVFGSTNRQVPYINKQQAADLLEVDEVLVGQSYINTANEAQSESLTPTWGDDVLVYYAPTAPSVEEPSFMYSMRWSANGLANMQAERHPFDPKTKSEEVEIGYYQDEKITGAELGFLLTAVNSST